MKRKKKSMNAADCSLSFLKHCLQDAKDAKDGARIKRMEEIIEYNYPNKQ